MKLIVGSFDLMAFQIDLCSIDSIVDPIDQDRGSMTIRVEGEIGDTKRRLDLIDGVVLHATQRSDNFIVCAGEMPECAVASVVPRLQSIPRSDRFVLIWESDRPYFVGTDTGRKYQL